MSRIFKHGDIHLVTKPFAGYDDFEDCVSQNEDKENPEAYCAVIMRQTEMALRGKVAPDGETVDLLDRPAPRSVTTQGMDDMTATEKAEWTTAYVNDLPDSCFLYIQPGGTKDAGGKTEPRSYRHFPYKGADGEVDLPHLRNALARMPQSNAPGLTPEKVRQLQDRGRRILSGEQDTEKAGRRLAGSMRDRLASLAASIKEVLSWADYEDSEEESKHKELPPFDSSTFFVFKDATGKDRWLSFSSNGFLDREKEIVSTAALEEAVAYADRTGKRGPLRIWHTPGTDIGTCDFQGVQGRFLIESGNFLDTPMGQKAKEFFTSTDERLGVSIGFAFPEAQFDGEVYSEIRFLERSVCPHEAVANPWTTFHSLKGVQPMDSLKASFMENVLGADLAQQVLKSADAATKELEGTVAYKATQEAQKGSPAAIATAVEAMKAAIGEAPSDAVKRAWADLTKALADDAKQATEKKEADPDPETPQADAPAAGVTEDRLVSALQELLTPIAAALTKTQSSVDAIDGRMKAIEEKDAAAAKAHEEATAAQKIADAAAEAEKANNRPRGADVYRASASPDNTLDGEKAQEVFKSAEAPKSPVTPYIEDILKGGIR